VSRPARILAVLASAVLGVGGGVAAALLMDSDTQGSDPLNLGVTLVEQRCTGDFLLVTAVGDFGSALAPGTTPYDGHAHYLKISDSCPTAWRPHGTVTAGYAAYLGPYGNGGEACAARVRLRGAFVTRLHEGNQQATQCLCYLSEASLPRFTPGMAIGVDDGVYARALEDLLTSMKLLPDTYHYSGRFDPPLVAAVKKVQADATLPRTGVTDLHTWQSAIKQGCKNLTD
jgi:hypothetical protein